MKITASDLVTAIAQLHRANHERVYAYFNDKTKSRLTIERITRPEGPIVLKRWNPSKGEKRSAAKTETISAPMLHRVAYAIQPGIPINLDRVLGASYNTRSALETLLGYTPEFHFCYPGRIEVHVATQHLKRGHKHLLYTDEKPHKLGVHSTIETSVTISELPGSSTVYEAVILPDTATSGDSADPEIRRLHAQMQYSLIKIACGLDCTAFVAKNDQATRVGKKKFAELCNVVCELRNQKLFSAYPDAAAEARLIDCIWLKNGRFMPAVFEVEVTTGIVRGLHRMKAFKDKFINLEGTNYVIAAPDKDRARFMKLCSERQFRTLNAKFLPFSSIHELYSMKCKGRLRGMPFSILDNFLESAKN